jgi:hypothetical protein
MAKKRHAAAAAPKLDEAYQLHIGGNTRARASTSKPSYSTVHVKTAIASGFLDTNPGPLIRRHESRADLLFPLPAWQPPCYASMTPSVTLVV